MSFNCFSLSQGAEVVKVTFVVFRKPRASGPKPALVRAFNSGYIPLFLQPVIDTGFEKFQGHLFRNPTLVEFQLRPYHNDGSPGVINPFAEEVLSESSLLAPQHIAQ